MESVDFEMDVKTLRAVLVETTLGGKLSWIALIHKKNEKLRIKSGVVAPDKTVGNFLIWYPEGIESSNIGDKNIVVYLDNMTYLEYLNNLSKKLKGTLSVSILGENDEGLFRGTAIQLKTESGQKFSIPLNKTIDESNEYAVSLTSQGERKDADKNIMQPTIQARTTAKAVVNSLSIYDAMTKEDKDYLLSFTKDSVLFLLGQTDNPTLPFADLPLEAEMVKPPKKVENIPIVSVLQDVVQTIPDGETIDLSVYDEEGRRFVEVKALEKSDSDEISKIRIIDLSTRSGVEDTFGGNEEDDYEEPEEESAIEGETGDTDNSDLL